MCNKFDSCGYHQCDSLYLCICSRLGWPAFLVGAQLLPLHIRGAELGIKTLVNWFAVTIVLLSFEPYKKAVNPWGTFFTFSFIMLCAVVFVYKFIPETKGKTLEEIQQSFRKGAKILPQQDSELVSVNQPHFYIEIRMIQK